MVLGSLTGFVTDYALDEVDIFSQSVTMSEGELCYDTKVVGEF